MALFYIQLNPLVAGYAHRHPAFVLNYQKVRHIGGYGKQKEDEPEPAPQG
jgi:hypothetical protein